MYKSFCTSLREHAQRLLPIAAVMVGTTVPTLAQEKILYITSNNIEDDKNAVIAYQRLSDGSVRPAGIFLMRGTGIDNDTNGKLGPNDNDTPIVVSADQRWLFAVNGHTNTIAGFRIVSGGGLEHVQGSPFPSMGVGPVSLDISGDVLLVANRNEDPYQLDALSGGAFSNYASFRINDDGSLTFISKLELTDGQKNTQVLVSSRDSRIVFGNDFQVDVDFDGEGSVSKLFGPMAAVRGGLRSFRLDDWGRLEPVTVTTLPETVEPAPEVPTVPLGIWDHPSKNLLYVGLVTRNQLGVYRYDDHGRLNFVTAVANSGQDICWVKTNAAGTRLYAVNNLPREGTDEASTMTVFDISGTRAEAPVEIGRVALPMHLGTFVNNRASHQPNSTAFQFDLSPDEEFLYVIMQRVDQTDANGSPDGNIIHTIRLDSSGDMEVIASRRLLGDGVPARARPQGVIAVDLAR